MQLVTNIYEANCITHSGTMHADEIFSTAFLDLYLENIKVYRITTIPKDLNENVLIYDIGRGKYDHHQENAKKRDDGITYCSFGLLWEEFGYKFLKKRNIKDIEEVFNIFDKDLVESIDAEDNGVFPKIEASYRVKTLSEIFKLFNPSYKSNQDEQIQFKKAVELAKIIIEETLLNIIGKVIAKEQIIEKLKISKNHTLYLDEYMPYEQTLFKEDIASDIYFVVYPSNRGGYGIKTVPISQENNNKRKDFPLSWAGLDNEELEKISGIKGLRFCHLTRFLVTCDTLEAVEQVISKTLTEEQKEEILAKND